MLIKSSAIQRLLRENPNLKERRYGLPYVGARLDKEEFNPTVQEIADAIDFYGYEVRDENIVDHPDINLGDGNPIKCEPFKPAIDEMIKSLQSGEMYKYPYTEGDDNIRRELLKYIEQEGFINNEPYDYDDIDEKGLSIHNLTFLPSTSITFNIIINIISKPGDVVLVPGPSYGLFTIRAERAGAEVEIIPLEKEDNYLINPEKLAKTIDEINDSLQRVYNRRHGYVPRVVAFVNPNPNNPTGKVMGEKQADLLRDISQVCLDRGVFVIDDMVYRDTTYDETNIAKPIATIPGMFRNTITLFGLSKSYGMASLRAGFLIADEAIIREVINRIFQEMDSSPDIVGRALMGAFNTSPERNAYYQKYFKDIRNTYIYRFNLLKSFVTGIDSIEDPKIKEHILTTVKNTIKDETKQNTLLKGMPYTKFPIGLEPESGFFAILDFTELKGKTFRGKIIKNEKDLLEFFYKTSRIRFLIGQSISWPYKNELVGRINFAFEETELINALTLMNEALTQLKTENSYEIRLNRIEDQEQMAHIKVDSWNKTYKNIIDPDYLATLNYEDQTKRYIESFNEYKNNVLVAIDKETNKVIGYACFSLNENEFVDISDCELVSLYLDPKYTGKGIGKSLFRETIKILRGYNKRHMVLWCFKGNTNAIKFYKKLGGIEYTEKLARIGTKVYPEYAYLFDINKFEK